MRFDCFRRIVLVVVWSSCGGYIRGWIGDGMVMLVDWMWSASFRGR